MVAQKAEVYNGRLAMVAFALLIVRPSSVCTDPEFTNMVCRLPQILWVGYLALPASYRIVLRVPCTSGW